MPLYLDVHNLAGAVSAKDVADAHLKDLVADEMYEVKEGS